MPPSIKFRPNVPHTLVLSDPTGELDTVTNEVTYPTTQGELLTVSYRTAVKLNMLGLKPLEPFGICKRVDAEGVATWDVWLAPEAEKERAVVEIAPACCPACGSDRPDVCATLGHVYPIKTDPDATELETMLRKSLEAAPVKGPLQVVPRRKPIKRAPSPDQLPMEFDRGNGTTGALPKAAPVIAAAVRRGPPIQRIPMDQAFIEITAFVTRGLQAAGEQWTDQAKQDMISTIVIAAQKQGLLEVWERGK